MAESLNFSPLLSTILQKLLYHLVRMFSRFSSPVSARLSTRLFWLQINVLFLSDSTWTRGSLIDQIPSWISAEEISTLCLLTLPALNVVRRTLVFVTRSVSCCPRNRDVNYKLWKIPDWQRSGARSPSPRVLKESLDGKCSCCRLYVVKPALCCIPEDEDDSACLHRLFFTFACLMSLKLECCTFSAFYISSANLNICSKIDFIFLLLYVFFYITSVSTVQIWYKIHSWPISKSVLIIYSFSELLTIEIHFK